MYRYSLLDEVAGTSYKVGEDRSEVRLDLQVLFYIYIFLGNYVSLRDLHFHGRRFGIKVLKPRHAWTFVTRSLYLHHYMSYVSGLLMCFSECFLMASLLQTYSISVFL